MIILGRGRHSRARQRWGMTILSTWSWVVIAMSFSKVSDSAWILNGGAVLKVGIAVVVVSMWRRCIV